MTLKDKLFKRLPKKYHNIVKDIRLEDGLIDDCPYLLYFNDGVSFCGEEDMYSFPVKSITEAIKIVKCCEIKTIDDMLNEMQKELERAII